MNIKKKMQNVVKNWLDKNDIKYDEIPVICYDHPYNEELHSLNIYRCYSWYDIYTKINEIKINRK